LVRSLFGTVAATTLESSHRTESENLLLANALQLLTIMQPWGGPQSRGSRSSLVASAKYDLAGAKAAEARAQRLQQRVSGHRAVSRGYGRNATSFGLAAASEPQHAFHAGPQDQNAYRNGHTTASKVYGSRSRTPGATGRRVRASAQRVEQGPVPTNRRTAAGARYFERPSTMQSGYISNQRRTPWSLDSRRATDGSNQAESFHSDTLPRNAAFDSRRAPSVQQNQPQAAAVYIQSQYSQQRADSRTRNVANEVSRRAGSSAGHGRRHMQSSSALPHANALQGQQPNTNRTTSGLFASKSIASISSAGATQHLPPHLRPAGRAAQATATTTRSTDTAAKPLISNTRRANAGTAGSQRAGAAAARAGSGVGAAAPADRPMTSTMQFKRVLGGTAEHALHAANKSGIALTTTLTESLLPASQRPAAPGLRADGAASPTSSCLPSTAQAAAAGQLYPAGIVGGGDFTSTTCRCSNVPFVAGAAAATLKGHNPMTPKPNQDRMVLVEHPPSQTLIFAVFDGHGVNGHLVSAFMAERLPHECISDKRFSQDTVLGDVIADAILSLEMQLLQLGTVDTSLSGTTAVTGIIRNGRMYVAGVGDSRCILLNQLTPTSLPKVDAVTVDHKPDDPLEKKRILAAGGRVMATRNRLAPHIVGPARVWLKDVPAPGLAMSRSVGDMVAKAAGVVSTPDRVQRRLGGSASYAVMGSDGIWDFVSNEEVAQACKACGDPGKAAEVLIKTARGRWLERTGGSDDITIVVLQLAAA